MRMDVWREKRINTYAKIRGYKNKPTYTHSDRYSCMTRCNGP